MNPELSPPPTADELLSSAMSRTPNPAADERELRFMQAIEDINVLDAVCIFEGLQHRGILLQRIVREYCDEQRHRASLIVKVGGLNPTPTEASHGDGHALFRDKP